MRGLRKKLTVMAVGTVVGALAVVSAPQASASPAGVLATAEFGVAFRDHNNNGQCRSVDDGSGQKQQWAPEGTWTTPIAIDTDNRPGGCDMQFGLNNVDGSLTGLSLNYWFNPAGTGQCGGTANNAPVPYFPFPLQFFLMTPIVINTDNRQGGCELDFVLSGRNDIALDVKWEYNGDPGQCPGAQLQPANNPTFRVQNGQGLALFLDTDDRGGACFLSFRLNHI
jgi:hypothetical protein